MDIRFESEEEFKQFAVSQEREHGRIQIRVTENLLVHKFFVYLYHWCKDFPGGSWSSAAYFVTKDEDVALRLMDLEGG